MMTFSFIRITYLVLFSFFLISGCGEADSSPEPADHLSERSEEQASGPSLSFPEVMEAALNGEGDLVEKAADQGMDVDQSDAEGRTPLMLASFNGHTAIVGFLLEVGADIEKQNREGRTPLIFAASGPNPETVGLLLEEGADPDATDNGERWTPLMFAAAGGHADVVQTLLDHGADTELTDEDGETARDFARSNGHSEVAQLLEE